MFEQFDNPASNGTEDYKSFWNCLQLVNSQVMKNGTIVSAARDYFYTALEVCYLGIMILKVSWLKTRIKAVTMNP